jgi:large subunit ribosomal protein L4
MNLETYNISGEKSGSIDLLDSIYALEPNTNVISTLVDWHKSNIIQSRPTTKNRSEVKGTTQKYGRQKGGGGARHGSKKANIFRSGGMAHNLRGKRSSQSLPKKIKILGLKYVLSTKLKNNQIVVFDDFKMTEAKTKTLMGVFNKLNISSALVIEAQKHDENFILSSRNIKSIKYSNTLGINALDILKYEKFVMSKDAANEIQKRLDV